MDEHSRLPGVPLVEAPDPARFGDEIGLLALLASDPAFGIDRALALDAEAVSIVASGADGRDRWDHAWRRLGEPHRVAVWSGGGQSGMGEEPDPSAALESTSAAVHDGVSLRRAVRSRAADSGALLVQVDPVASARGVAYSEDPREDRVEQIHVDVWAAKERAAVRQRRDRDGGRWTTENPDAAAVVLPSAALEAVAEALGRAETTLGEAIALRWVWRAPQGADPGGLAVVGVAPQQSPLPWAIHRTEELPHDGWSRANAGEVMAGPVTPMTWAMLGEPLNGGFAAMFPDSWTEGRRYFALFGGYAYFNFGQVYHLLVERMGAPAPAMLAVVGGPGDARALGVPDRGLRWPTILRALPSIIRSTRGQRQMPDRWRVEHEALEALRDEILAVDVSDVDTPTIVSAIDNIYTRQGPHVRFFMEAQGAAFTSFGMLRHVCELFLGEASLANRLVQGLPDVMTSEINLRLWRLAQRAAAQPQTRKVVLVFAPGEMLGALRSREDSVWLAEELDAFLRDHAHRGTAELELLAPRWGDDPTPVLSSFQAYVRSPEQTSVEALVDRQRRDREAAQREVDARLTAHWWERLFPLRRGVLRNYTYWSRRYAPLRENPKAAVLAVAYEARGLLRVVGERLTAEGILRERDDVLFLDREELGVLATVVEGKRDAQQTLTIGRLRRRVARRRRFYREALERTPASIIGAGDGPEKRASVVADTAPSAGGAGSVLRGLAASRGVAEGAARILRTPSEADRLGAGDVLVARFTDPGWTHLFPLAGALVTEIGGVLSHGALVAREYGLPAVVNVPGATSIREGGRLRVDGAAGTVEVLD